MYRFEPQRRLGHLVCAVASIVLLSGKAMAQDSATPDAPSAIQFGAALTLDTLANTAGGLKEGAWTQGNLDLTAAWQGSKGWEGFGYVLVNQHGGFSSRYTGDVHGVSNIDAPPGVRLLEAWARHTSQDETFVTTFGVINLNGIFDTQPTGGVFLNSSHGIGPDYAQNGPSIFPYAGLGFVQEWRPSDTLRLRLGVFDAVPGDPDHGSAFTSLKLSHADGANVVIEAEQNFANGFVKLGHWSYTAKAPRLNGDGEGRRHGTYAQAGLTLFHEAEDLDQGMNAWVRVGVANGAVLDLSGYFGGGVVYTGLIPGRDHDAMGLSVASATFSPDLRRLNPGTKHAETTVELTYQAELRPGLILQPDFQYIHNPAGDPAAKDAVVLALRVRVDLGS